MFKTMEYKKHLDRIFRDLTTFGGIVFFALILAITLLVKNYQLFNKLIFGLILTFLVTILIRSFYHKNRPKKQTYTNFIEKMDAFSFPSWHTARIVFLALIFIYFFNNNTLTTFFIITAFLVAYSRIYLKKHDYWDVLGGIVLGIIAFWLSNLI